MDSQIYETGPHVARRQRAILDPPVADASANIVIIVSHHEFIRGCLEVWIKKYYQEFEVFGIDDITVPIDATIFNRSILSLFHASGVVLADSWLDEQVAWLRANQPNIPIVAVVEPDTIWPIAGLVNRFRLQGYIPTSSSMQLAAAVLRLVAAGGSYVPHTQNEDPPSMRAGKILRVSMAARVAGLTLRECGVLELLEYGMSNKIIAYRLSLSQSTVKAHVHNIILKLNVHNRTEAAVASHLSQPILTECREAGVVQNPPILDYMRCVETADREGSDVGGKGCPARDVTSRSGARDRTHVVARPVCHGPSAD